jgi:hypothetical protein
MYDLENESYLIFLDKKYFKKSIFSSIYKQFRKNLENSIYKKIRKNLENKGIRVVSITEIIERQNKQDNKIEMTFDDKKYPDTNTLYIHLFNGHYYNDSIYSKKKNEKERDMLLLIAGKLGVKESTYSTEITEIKIKKILSGVNIDSVDSSIGYEKQISKYIGQSGREVYLNRGAPVYLNMKSIIEVSNNLKETIGEMKSNSFSYDYFIKNPKLESFVYKRFAFKMIKLEYTIEEEDLTDLSFEVKACFFKYGINLEFNETIISKEKITYTFEFYNDQELMIKFNERDLEYSDNFVNIRLTYDNSDNKELSIHHICDYVFEESKKCFYRLINSNQTFNFYNKLNDWIITETYEKFVEVCKGFYSTTQIKNWIYRILSNNQIEIIYLDKHNKEIKKDIVLNNISKNDNITEIPWYKTNSFCLKDHNDNDNNNDNDNDNVSSTNSNSELQKNNYSNDLYEKQIKELFTEIINISEENTCLKNGIVRLAVQNDKIKKETNQELKNIINELEKEKEINRQYNWGDRLYARQNSNNEELNEILINF